MKLDYIRKFRNKGPIDWELVTQAWIDLMHTNVAIQFKDFFSEIVEAFAKSPHDFLSNVKTALNASAKIPDDFLSKDIYEKTISFFAFFRFIFDFQALDEFVCQANFEPENFRKHFGDKTYHLFDSICYLYQEMSEALDENTLHKISVKMITLLSKLLVPDGYSQLTSKNFCLEHVYISPVFYTKSEEKIPGFCCIEENGSFLIIDAIKETPIEKFTNNDLTGLMEESKLFFYDSGDVPVIELEFPSPDNANDAFIFSLTPPERGLMELTYFLHSLSAFKNIKTFFPLKTSPNIILYPKEFKNGLQKCIESPSLELLFYTFSIPQKETKVKDNNVPFFLSAIGKRFLPFIRALIHMNWVAAPYSGHIVLRHDSPLSTLCREFLKIYASDYLNDTLKRYRNLIEIADEKIGEMPISNDEDAVTFINYVFTKEFDDFLNSVDRMPDCLRTLFRTLFIRTAGFYIGQTSPFIIIPNLLLLRFLLPPYTTSVQLTYQGKPKLIEIGKLAYGSFLPVFYRNGWPIDSYLSQFNCHMERYYPETTKFVFRLIDSHNFSFEPKVNYLDGDIIGLLSDAASNLILMNLKDPNKILSTHIYSISIMQMIEEFSYDFTIPPKED